MKTKKPKLKTLNGQQYISNGQHFIDSNGHQYFEL